MKVFKYKYIAILMLLGFGLQAQTFDKKINESFKVNPEVELEINASHTDVTVETWNRNVVSIEAVMEVEGVSKQEADKILDKWNFEALGNKTIVKVNSSSENIEFAFNFPEIEFEIPEFNFEMPEMPKMHKTPKMSKMPKRPKMPEMPQMPEIVEIEFDYEAYKNDSTYLKRYKEQVASQVIKFKNSGWVQMRDSLRNSDEYKRAIDDWKQASKEIAREMNDLRDSEQFREAIVASKEAALEVRKEMLENKELWKEQANRAQETAKMAMEMVKEMQENGTFDSIQNFSENIYFNYGEAKNSKIKIKKYLKIKVPKNATFNFNVRHGKLNIPDSNKKISATISYGDFNGGIIVGDSNYLNISNSPIVINTLESANITLKNVPNAKFGTFENVNLFSNYTDVFIQKIGGNNALSNKFGKIVIVSSTENFEKLNLILDYSKATVDLSNSAYNYQISNKKSSLILNDNIKKVMNKTRDGVQIIEGYNLYETTLNKLFLTSVYSSVKLN